MGGSSLDAHTTLPTLTTLSMFSSYVSLKRHRSGEVRSHQASHAQRLQALSYLEGLDASLAVKTTR